MPCDYVYSAGVMAFTAWIVLLIIACSILGALVNYLIRPPKSSEEKRRELDEEAEWIRRGYKDD